MKAYAALCLVLILVILSSGCVQQMSDIRGGPVEPRYLPFYSDGSDVIGSTTSNVSVHKAGTNTDFEILVRKTKYLEGYQYFGFCVARETSEYCATPKEGLQDTVANGDKSGISFMFIPVIRLNDRGDAESINLHVKIPSETPMNTYDFRFFICPLNNSEERCENVSDAAGHYTFHVTVE